MRQIKNFLITRTKLQYPEVSEKSKGIGMIYPMPHFYVYKFEQESKEEYPKHLRGRPYSEKCALMREGLIASNAIGIMIYAPTDVIPKDVVQLVGSIIRLVADDLGIKNYGILTDEINNENRVDVLEFYTAAEKSPSIFSKRIDI